MSLTALNAAAYLHHLHLGSPDPAALAKFYGEVMEMPAEQQGDRWLCAGPGRRLIISAGEKNKLKHGAFACRDAEALAELHARAEREGLAPKPFSDSLFRPGAFAVTDPDGNVIVFGLAAEEPPRRGKRGPLQHLTLATRNVEAIEGFYAGKLGFAVSDHVRNPEGKLMTCFMRSTYEHHNLGVFLQDRQGIDHHSYEAGEWNVIRDWCDHFAERDIQLMWGPGRHGPGNNLFIFITDPDGNWIEVSAEIEAINDRPLKTWPHGERTLNLWGRAILRA